MGGKTEWIKVTIVDGDNTIINTFIGTTEKVVEQLELAIAATKQKWAADDPGQQLEEAPQDDPATDAAVIDDLGQQPEQQQGDATEETPAAEEPQEKQKVKNPHPWA